MAEIKSRIRVKRCTNTSLSSHKDDILPAGAPLYNTDTGELFVGDGVKKLNDEYSSVDESNRLDSISANKLLSKIDASKKRNTLGIHPMFAYLENGPFKVDSVRLRSDGASSDAELNCSNGKGISIGPATINPSDINKNTLTKESILLNASIESRRSAMSGEGSVAVGRTTDTANSLKASGLNSIAIGTNAQAVAENAVAIGNGTKATEKDQVVLGNYDFSKIFENDFITSKIATSLKNIGIHDSIHDVNDTSISFSGIYVDLGNYTTDNSILRLTILRGDKTSGPSFGPIWPSGSPENSVQFKFPTKETYLYAIVSRDTAGIGTGSGIDWNNGAGYSVDIDVTNKTVTIHPNHSIGTPTLLILGVVSQ